MTITLSSSNRIVRTGLLIVLCASLCDTGAISAQDHGSGRASQVDPNLPEYHPQTVPTPHDHGYVMPDGSIRIVGFDDMTGMVTKWDQEFARTHPGFKFTPILKGNGTAIPAITYDMAAFAPEGGGATLLELLPYEKIYGSKKDPVAALIIRVAHGSLNPAAKTSPLGIIVNKSNPIQSLTVEQVASIFSTGSGTGDVTGWSQIGLGGGMAGKPIHPTGLYYDQYQRPDDPNMGEYMMYRKFGKFPGYVFASSYEQYYHYSDVVKKVAGDPYAIGIVALNQLDASVREVPIVGEDGHTLTTGTPSELIADRYPYGRDLYIYIRREPGTPFEPMVEEYMRMVLSKAGQEAVAQDAKGYLPLNAEDVKDGLERLERAKTWAPRSQQGPKTNFPFPSPEPLDK
jgi:phosphate transport system substrate-binding protein